MTKIDLLDYLRGAVGPGQRYGRPVGIRYSDGREGVFQVLRMPGSRRWLQLKGAWNSPPPPAHLQEHWYDDVDPVTDCIWFAIDTSRIAAEGGPYTLRDVQGQRGSRWARRFMAVGDVFRRSAYIVAFEPDTGREQAPQGPVESWLRLEAIHDNWQGLGRKAVELRWYLDAALTDGHERYYYIEGCGLGGWQSADGRGSVAQHIWDLPPAHLVPELPPLPLGFELTPALPEAPTVTPPPADGFTLLNPCHAYPYFIWSGYGERPTPETSDPPETMENHFALDIVPGQGAVAPYPVVAAAAGRVVMAGWNDQGYGWMVKLDHGDRRETLYAHLEENSLAVQVGDHVIADQSLGRMDATGRTTGRHLHFEYRVAGMLIDPTPLLRDTIAPPVVEPEPEPTPDPVTPPDGIPSPWLTSDEIQQAINAMTAQREALNRQIAIFERALQRATA